tara:strand:- start:755 stop:1057 length:303 start_codon:yes stop_codon:yes gene_type:complete
MSLFGKLLLAKFVKNIELFGERFAIFVTNRCKLDLDDNLSIRGHHSNTSEKYLKVFWELLSTSITWVHCDEIGASWDEHNWLFSVWEHESFKSLFLSKCD